MKLRKIIALILSMVIILPVLAACGESTPAKTDDPTTAGEETTPEPTPAPTTTEPTTPEPTEPPTEAPTFPPIDPALPYFEQMDLEFGYMGFVGGEHCVSLDGEEATMKKLTMSGSGKREEIDLSADLSAASVPFKYAYRYNTPSASTNAWDIQATNTMIGDFKEGDIIAGVIWARDGGGEEMAVSNVYVKYTVDWPTWSLYDTSIVCGEDGWVKYYFAAEVGADTKGSNIQMQMFLGTQSQSIEMGGYYVKKFEGNPENFKAAYVM